VFLKNFRLKKKLTAEITVFVSNKEFTKKEEKRKKKETAKHKECVR